MTGSYQDRRNTLQVTADRITVHCKRNIKYLTQEEQNLLASAVTLLRELSKSYVRPWKFRQNG